MNREKRGGAHLEKNLTAKKTAPTTPKNAPVSGAPKKKASAGLDRRKKTILIVALILVGLVLLAVVLKSILGSLFGRDGLLGGLPEVPSYNSVTDPDSGDVPTRSEADSVRKEGYYTFLVVGRDTGGGGNTDTIMLCSYDIPNQKLTVMSIPRDTLVDARHPDKNKKINGVWNLGLYYAKKGSEKTGADYLKEAVGDMTGIVPDFHVVVNWEAFGRLVDAIGGVDFEVPFDMKYKDPAQNLVIDQPGGFRHLSGDDAMQVVRWRHNNSGSVQYADADLGRIRTQQALMKEIIKKCLRIENITKIGDFVEIFAEEVETDLTVGNILAFAQRAMDGLDMDNVIFITMPVRAANGGSVQANPDELLGILNESFNPYVKPLGMEELRILQYSASKGLYVYQGTGNGTAPTYSSDVKPAQAVTKPESTQTASPSPSPSASAEPQSSTRPSEAPDDDETAPPSASASPTPSAQGTHEPDPTPTPTTAPPAAEPPRDPADLGIPMD